VKIFIILSRVPFPLDKGDKLRAYNQLKYLHKNHELFICALTDKKITPDAEKALADICSEYKIIMLSGFRIFFNLIHTAFSGKPFQVGYFFDSSAKKQVNELIERFKPDHLFCQLIRVTEYVKDLPYPKTIDYMDALSKGMERRKNLAPWYVKPLFNAENRRLLKYEKDIFNKFNNKIIISEQDKEFINHPEREKIKIVPNGVNLNFFKSSGIQKDFDLVFTGNMSYPPNINCAEYIVKEVLPLVKKQIPDIKLLISGVSPSPKIISLQSKNVTVSGWVDDIRKSYDRAKIFFAPMQIGTGMQNKILEAMAMKVPCITSRLAGKALGAIDKKHVLMGNSPEEYASLIINLLYDKKRQKELTDNAYYFVSDLYSWNRNGFQLEEILKG
jgi:polysaccharide biosynthesis protein PslH